MNTSPCKSARGSLGSTKGKEPRLTNEEEMVLLNRRQPPQKPNSYSFSFMAGMTQDKVISMQVIEGGTDGVIFENFVYRTLNKLRSDPKTADKDIVIVADNARIHHCQRVYDTVLKMKATLLFSAQYSPWL